MAQIVSIQSTEKAKVVPKYKLGATLKWKSQSQGVTRTKEGTVVAVLRKGVDYHGLYNIPKKFFVDRFISLTGETRNSARERLDRAWNRSRLLVGIFALRFNPNEGMTRDEVHYLLSVPSKSGRGALRLYHPRAGQKFEVVDRKLLN